MSQNQQEQSEAKLLAYLEGELDPAGRAEIEKHLEAHPQHGKLLEELKGMRDWVRWLPRESAPADVIEQFQGHLERSALLGDGGKADRPDPRMRINRWPQIRAAAAVAGLAVGLGAIVYISLPSSHNNPYANLPTPKLPNDKVTTGSRTTNPAGRVAPDGRKHSTERELAFATPGSPGTPEAPRAAGPTTSDADTLSAKPGGPTTAPEEPGHGDMAKADLESGEKAKEAGLNSSTRPRDPAVTSVALANDAAPPAAPAAPAPVASPVPEAVAPTTPAMLAPAAAPGEPSEKLEEVARHYFTASSPTYNAAYGRGDAPRLERAEVDRRVAERRAADKLAMSREAKRSAPLVMVVLAPDTEQARNEITAYCETNRLAARFAASGGRTALAGDGFGDAARNLKAQERLGDASSPAPAPAAPGSTRGAGTGGGGAPGGLAAGSTAPGAAPAPVRAPPTQGAMAKSGIRAGENPAGSPAASPPAGFPAAASPPAAARPQPPAPKPAPGGAPAREFAQARDGRNEKRMDTPPAAAAQHPAGAAAATPPPASEPRTSRTPGPPGSAAAPALPRSPGASASGGAGPAGVANPSKPADAPAADLRDSQGAPRSIADQFPNAPLDNSVYGAASGRKAISVSAGNPVVVRMTARQATELQASLSRPVASQWAAVYEEPEGLDSLPSSALADGVKDAAGPRQSGSPVDKAAVSRSGADIAPSVDAKGSFTPAAGVYAAGAKQPAVAARAPDKSGSGAGGAVTQPTTPAAPAAVATGAAVPRSGAVPRDERFREAAAPARPATFPVAPIAPSAPQAPGGNAPGAGRADQLAIQQQAEQRLRQTPATNPAGIANGTLSDDDQPIDVVILLEHSPQAATATQPSDGRAIPASEPSK